MIDVLYGRALHSYFLKIEIESPDGILETLVKPLISQHNLFTVRGKKELAMVIQDVFKQVRTQTPDNYGVDVSLVIDRLNSLIMN